MLTKILKTHADSSNALVNKLPAPPNKQIRSSGCSQKWSKTTKKAVILKLKIYKRLHFC